MDKTSKKLMEHVLKINDIADLTYAFVNDKDKEIGDSIGIDVHQVKRCVSYLAEQGYLQYTFTKDTTTGFIPTHIGYHYKEFAFRNFIKAFTSTVIVPILVSIATTITLYMLGLTP